MNREEYEQMYRLEDTYWWFVARRDLLMGALRRFPPPRPVVGGTPRLLDVGCGTGGTLDRLRAEGLPVVGLDMEPLALSFCRERGHRDLVQGSATALPFGEGTFAAAVAMDVLEHIPDDRAAAQEIARVLVPGGLLFATVPAYPSLWSGHDVALMHQRRYVAPGFKALLCGAGLELVHLTYTVSTIFPAVWLIRAGRRRFAASAAPKADVAHLPAIANKLLRAGQGIENSVSLRTRLPFGLSLLAVARKPLTKI